jgi:hypothetical protein
MKKQLRNIVISFCVVAVLVVGIISFNFFMKPKSTASSSQSSSTSSIAVFKTDSTKVTSLQVKNSKGEYTIRQSGGKFTVDNVSSTLLNQSNLSGAVVAASDVEASQLIEKDSTNLKQYGLDNPAIVLTVTSSGGKSSIIDLGNTTPGGDGSYVKMDGSSDVYMTADTTLSGAFSSAATYYVNTTIASLDSTKLAGLTSITFGGASRSAPIVLNEENSSTSTASTSSGSVPTYEMSSPRNYSLDVDKISTLTTALESLSASSVLSLDVSATNLAKYGLKNPEYTFGFTYNGQKTVIDVGTPYDDSGTPYLPIVVEGMPAIYSIAQSDMSFYNWQMQDMCSTMLFAEYIDTVKSVTVTSGSESYTINFSGSGTNIIGTYGTKKLDTTDLRNFYQDVVAIGFEGQATKPQNGSVYCHVEVDYHDASKAPTKMDFISMDSLKCFWSINGQGDFYVLKQNVDTLIDAARDLSAGKTVTTS